ncbi:MAG: tetratricopeptide repeat protein [Gammaproteobacteria bacterium]|jgi:tetratricopeptide (TPR) repeat protein
MATVSGSYHSGLLATLLVAFVASGCNALMPVVGKSTSGAKASTEEESNTDAKIRTEVKASAVKRPAQRVRVPTSAVPLPRQPYDSAGQKVAYVSQPNPYTTETVVVPPEARSIFFAGSGMLRIGDLKGARRQFQTLTEKFPTLSGPWVRLGVIAEKNERYEDAIEHYRKAISVNRNNVNAYMALGLVQRRQGRFSDAQATYLEALEVWKDFPEAHLNLGILYDLYVNQPEEAQKHYEAYYFLTGEKDEKVHKWLVEVKRRTGIERSFIDIPPKEIAEVPAKETDGEADVLAESETSG